MVTGDEWTSSTIQWSNKPAAEAQLEANISHNEDVAEGGHDYHWYRQDADGFWSHKQGVTAVRRTDDSGKLIADPYTANRGSHTIFVNYYAVTTWNNIYVSSATDGSASYILGDNNMDSLPYADLDKVALIQNDMTLEEVASILQVEGRDVGFGTIIHEYQTQTGVLTIAYCIDDNGIYRVVNVSHGGEMQ